MRLARSLGPAAVVVLGAAVAAPGALPAAFAEEPADPHAGARAALDAAEEALLGAAAAMIRDESPAALVLLDAADGAARASIDAFDGRRVAASVRRRVAALRGRIGRAEPVLASASTDAQPAVLALRRAIVAARRAQGALRGRGAPFRMRVAGGPEAVVARPGARTVVRVLPQRCAESAAASLTNDDPETDALTVGQAPLHPGRFTVVWGSAPGTARLTVTACGGQRVVRFLNLGPEGALAAAPPRNFAWAGVVHARAGRPAEGSRPSLDGDGPFTFTVVPALPAGLSLDPSTGSVSGAPLAGGAATTHQVTVRNARGRATADLVLDPDPPLPEGMEDLAGGFAAAAVVRGAEFPAKIAVADDGRVFYSELLTGRVRIVSAAGSLDPSPIVTVPVLTGGERGLLGIALAPDFAASGAFLVYASTGAGDGRPDRNRVLRYVLSGGVASGPEVVIDDLPIGDTQNAGALAFGPDGKLYVTVGDTGDADLAQADGSLAGRVLRFEPDGSVPADNPVAGSPEWARGFRNPYGIAFQPGTGRLFATENGPTAHDELDYVQPGRNFEWGAPPDASFGAFRGVRIVDWTPVIVPTGIAIHPGPGFGDGYADDLFVASYDHAEVRRLRLAGVDLESEEEFLRFTPEGLDQKPLDLAVAPDGALWVSTFTTLWRITRD